MAPREPVVDVETREPSERVVVVKGALCSAASSLVVSICLVAVVMLDGYTHLYSLALIGVAAGGAMATQVPAHHRLGSLTALVTTGIVMALTIPAVSTASALQGVGMDREEAVAEITRAFDQVGGLTGSYLWLVDTGGGLVAAYAGAALVLAWASSLLLGRRDHRA